MPGKPMKMWRAMAATVGFPSASDDFLGTGRWTLGPELVLGISARRWVTVLVVRNEWSVGSNGARPDVNTLLLEYLLFYNLPKLFYLVYEPAITADWEAPVVYEIE